MLLVAKITVNGQITIPQPIRDLLEWDAGDYVEIDLIRKVTKQTYRKKKSATPPEQEQHVK